MKKRLGILLFSFFLVFLLTSCDEVLSVVTQGADGKKIVNSYVSMIGDKVYDESSSINSWQDLAIFEGEEVVSMDNLIFKIINKKENIVVFGDKDVAVEISFFDGGYKYTYFVSQESLSNAIDNL